MFNSLATAVYHNDAATCSNISDISYACSEVSIVCWSAYSWLLRYTLRQWPGSYSYTEEDLRKTRGSILLQSIKIIRFWRPHKLSYSSHAVTRPMDLSRSWNLCSLVPSERLSGLFLLVSDSKMPFVDQIWESSRSQFYLVRNSNYRCKTWQVAFISNFTDRSV